MLSLTTPPKTIPARSFGQLPRCLTVQLEVVGVVFIAIYGLRLLIRRCQIYCLGC